MQCFFSVLRDVGKHFTVKQARYECLERFVGDAVFFLVCWEMLLENTSLWSKLDMNGESYAQSIWRDWILTRHSFTIHHPMTDFMKAHHPNLMNVVNQQVHVIIPGGWNHHNVTGLHCWYLDEQQCPLLEPFWSEWSTIIYLSNCHLHQMHTSILQSL